MKLTINVYYIQLIDGAIYFNYVISDFLPVRSVISDREVLRSPTIRVASSISLCNSISFVSHSLTLCY